MLKINFFVIFTHFFSFLDPSLFRLFFRIWGMLRRRNSKSEPIWWILSHLNLYNEHLCIVNAFCSVPWVFIIERFYWISIFSNSNAFCKVFLRVWCVFFGIWSYCLANRVWLAIPECGKCGELAYGEYLSTVNTSLVVFIYNDTIWYRLTRVGNLGEGNPWEVQILDPPNPKNRIFTPFSLIFRPPLSTPRGREAPEWSERVVCYTPGTLFFQAHKVARTKGRNLISRLWGPKDNI